MLWDSPNAFANLRSSSLGGQINVSSGNNRRDYSIRDDSTLVTPRLFLYLLNEIKSQSLFSLVVTHYIKSARFFSILSSLTCVIQRLLVTRKMGTNVFKASRILNRCSCISYLRFTGDYFRGQWIPLMLVQIRIPEELNRNIDQKNWQSYFNRVRFILKLSKTHAIDISGGAADLNLKIKVLRWRRTFMAEQSDG